MISIDEGFVEAAAPNADAAEERPRAGPQEQVPDAAHRADETLLFGQCQGSGKEPYLCSCDFARPEQPTYRCNCPSRQFPCKHCWG